MARVRWQLYLGFHRTFFPKDSLSYDDCNPQYSQRISPDSGGSNIDPHDGQKGHVILTPHTRNTSDRCRGLDRAVLLTSCG